MELIEITVTRMIPATPEEVYDVWVEPNSPGGPWHGAARLIVNPVVDGLFYFAVNHEGRVWPHYGRFVKLERPKLVEYTWMSEATKGAESTVTFTLEKQGGDTKVTLRHAGVPDDALGRQHKDGWEWILGALANALSKRK